MRMQNVFATMFGAFCLMSLSVAQADDNHNACVFEGNIVSTSQIVKAAQDMNYTPIKTYINSNVELEDECIYEIEAKDRAEQRWKLIFDPTTGKLIAKKADHD